MKTAGQRRVFHTPTTPSFHKYRLRSSSSTSVILWITPFAQQHAYNKVVSLQGHTGSAQIVPNCGKPVSNLWITAELSTIVSSSWYSYGGFSPSY